MTAIMNKSSISDKIILHFKFTRKALEKGTHKVRSAVLLLKPLTYKVIWEIEKDRSIEGERNPIYSLVHKA